MTTIARNMSELGFAPVIAVLARGGDDVATVGKHFSAQRYSQFGSASLTEKRLSGASRPRAEGARGYRNLGVVYGTVDRQGLAALRAGPRVRKVTAAPEFSLIRPVAKSAAVLPKTNTWGLEAMEVPALWAEGLSGKDVRIAHLDTGVDATHPALRTAVVKFAEFDRAGRERPGAEPYDSDAEDSHGTHTAATIAGRPVRGSHVGVAPGACLYSAMVIEGGDIVARILGGMDWAAGGRRRQRGPRHQPVTGQLPARVVRRCARRAVRRGRVLVESTIRATVPTVGARRRRTRGGRRVGGTPGEVPVAVGNVDGHAPRGRSGRLAHRSAARRDGQPPRAGDLRLGPARPDGRRASQPRRGQRRTRVGRRARRVRRLVVGRVPPTG